MCNRFRNRKPIDQMAIEFEAEALEADRRTKLFNIAPTDLVAVVGRRERMRRIHLLHWGRVPGTRKPGESNPLTNARAETIMKVGLWRDAFLERRVLVPAEGFYESTGPRGAKAAWLFRPPDHGLVALAGIEHLRGAVAVVTTEPNRSIREYHDRMPVVLPKSAWDAWLDPDTPVPQLFALLVAPEEAAFEVARVSSQLWNPRVEGPELEPQD